MSEFLAFEPWRLRFFIRVGFDTPKFASAWLSSRSGFTPRFLALRRSYRGIKPLLQFGEMRGLRRSLPGVPVIVSGSRHRWNLRPEDSPVKRLVEGEQPERGDVTPDCDEYNLAKGALARIGGINPCGGCGRIGRHPGRRGSKGRDWAGRGGGGRFLFCALLWVFRAHDWADGEKSRAVQAPVASRVSPSFTGDCPAAADSAIILPPGLVSPEASPSVEIA